MAIGRGIGIREVCKVLSEDDTIVDDGGLTAIASVESEVVVVGDEKHGFMQLCKGDVEGKRQVPANNSRCGVFCNAFAVFR